MTCRKGVVDPRHSTGTRWSGQTMWAPSVVAILGGVNADVQRDTGLDLGWVTKTREKWNGSGNCSRAEECCADGYLN